MHRGQRASRGNRTGTAIKAGYKDAADFFAPRHEFFLQPGRHPYKNAMATSPDLPTPITADPPDLPDLPVEPDKGPAAPPGNPTDPESPFTVQPE